MPQRDTFVPDRFSFDEGEHTFAGYHDPRERWNGFATPAFPLTEARRIARVSADLRRQDGVDAAERIRYDARTDSFLIDNPENHPGEKPEREHGFDIETTQGKRHVYGIGRMGWTWMEKSWWADAEPGHERRRSLLGRTADRAARRRGAR